jgi:phosphoenolpyruvate carboxykinase (GTP)
MDSVKEVIDKYYDLKQLFKKMPGKNILRGSILSNLLSESLGLVKINRIEEIYRNICNAPKILFKVLSAEKSRLYRYREKFGDYISPQNLV